MGLFFFFLQQNHNFPIVPSLFFFFIYFPDKIALNFNVAH